MIDQLDLIVGRRLRTRRRIVGLTQAQVGDLMGVRFQQVQKYESGANRMSLARFIQFCEALRANPAEIVATLTTDDPTPKEVH